MGQFFGVIFTAFDYVSFSALRSPIVQFQKYN